MTPGEAEQAVLDPNALVLETQYVDGEERIRAIGMTRSGRILTIAYTERDELIRLVTAFDASRIMKQGYLRRDL